MLYALQLLPAYLWENKFLSLAGFYFLVSAGLKSFTPVDICLPCLWKTVFGVSCPGCGLTSAFIQLVLLDPVGAWQANPLIFVVLPAALFFIIRDFVRFRAARLSSGVFYGHKK